MRRSGGGAIVNVVSIYAMVGSAYATAYHASKGAAQEVEHLRPVAGAGEDEDAASGEAGHVGLRDADGGGRGHQRVDRVPAASEHPEAGERGQRIRGRHHAASPEGDRPDAEPRGVGLVGRRKGRGGCHA